MSSTTDRDDPRLNNILPDGQQEVHVVLSEEERAKGWVRPYRDTYNHQRCGGDTRMGRAIAETYARDPRFYSGTFCMRCGTYFPLDEFRWLENGKVTDIVVGS